MKVTVFQPNNNYYNSEGNSFLGDSSSPHLENRAPEKGDFNYSVGRKWVDLKTSQEYTLNKVEIINGVKEAVWHLNSNFSGVPTKQNQSTGNIQLVGGSNQIHISSNPFNHDIQISVNNPFQANGVTSSGPVNLNPRG